MVRRITKTGADAVQQAALGHNSERSNELLKEYVQKAAKKMRAINALNGELKDILNEAKADGFLKTSIRKSIKKLEATAEQRQAQKEVELETDRITQLCSDLPLFGGVAKTEAPKTEAA